MYQASTALFLYAVSPVHMGAGSAFGLIDSPIQRERHTEFPLFAGSGIKGAVRHRFAQLPGWKGDLLERFFGPESGEELFAGAVSFGDAQLIAFPVRSLRSGYVYATCPLALARAARQLRLLGKAGWPEQMAPLKEGECRLASDDLLHAGKLQLEALEFRGAVDSGLQAIAKWLDDNALPQDEAHAFFRAKLQSDLVLLADEEFAYFVRNATVVEPHVRIDDKTGAASEGGLFYVENLPPESLLVAPLFASAERSGKGEVAAEAVLAHVTANLDKQMIQIGGDATTGRGQVVVSALQ